MKFQIPEQFKIGAYTWEIRLVKAGALVCEEDAKNEKTYGVCDTLAATITIDDGQPPIHALSTLMHEVLHAINFTLGIDRDCGECPEHEYLDAQANLLTQFLLSCEGKASVQK